MDAGETEKQLKVEQSSEEPVDLTENESEIEQTETTTQELGCDEPSAPLESTEEEPEQTNKGRDENCPDENCENQEEAKEDLVEKKEESENEPEITTHDEEMPSETYRIPKLSESSDKANENEDTVDLSVEEDNESEELLIEDEANDPEDDQPSTSDNRRSRDKETSHQRKRSRSKSTERMPSGKDTPHEIRSRVFVGHLNTDEVDVREVKRLFSPYGRVVNVWLNKGYGFVQYDNEDSARAAINEVHGTPLAGMKIVVDKTVKHKRMIGEDPKSERPLPKGNPIKKHRDRFDLAYEEMEYRRERELRYARLEELERRYFYDRPPPPRPRDPYYDRLPYMDRLPPPHYMDYDRGRYADLERRDRYMDDPYRRRRDSYDDYRAYR